MSDEQSAAQTPSELLDEIEDAQSGDLLMFDEAGGAASDRRERTAMADELSQKRMAGRKSTVTHPPTGQSYTTEIQPQRSAMTRRELADQLSRVEEKLDQVLEELNDD